MLRVDPRQREQALGKKLDGVLGSTCGALGRTAGRPCAIANSDQQSAVFKHPVGVDVLADAIAGQMAGSDRRSCDDPPSRQRVHTAAQLTAGNAVCSPTLLADTRFWL